MPTISMFFGIIVRMYNEKGARHNKPHIHAIYQEQEIVIGLDCEIMEGSLQANKLRMVLAWIEIHREELEANWQLLSNGEEFFKVEPLK